jgi:asparagine synthase (glutamine-hydrolysing)
MCGIVGAIASTPIEGGLLDRMRDSLAHRGPDHAGSWISCDGKVALGHRRLAIIDLLPEANQPFASSDGRFLLVYNGELYNYRELKTEMEALGVRFRTRSDSEVLLEAYRLWGERALLRFSGMFAFAIWDESERTLFCARDRAGEKPFYYAEVAGAFLFASEPKALLSWPGFSRRIHYPALLDYLAYGFVPDPKCIWESCAKLAAGHCMIVRTSTDGSPHVVSPHPWWDWSFNPDSGERDWTNRVLSTLSGAAREMAVADVPLGVFLSGGVDSSSVVAALAQGGEQLKTFTIGFNDAAYDERKWAEAVAGRFGTEHRERVVEPEETDAAFDDLLWHFDEPFSDPSFLPTYYLAREARREVVVVQSGDGADESFAGYRKYSRMMRRIAVRRFLPDQLLSWAARIAEHRFAAGSWIRRLSAKYGYDPASMLAGFLTLTPCLMPSGLEAHTRGPLAHAVRHYNPRDVITGLMQKAPPEEVGMVNTLRYIDLKHTLAGDILVKVDRACMAVALEVRPVYLHRDMLELAGAIPSARLVDATHTKEVLKTAVETWLPSANVRRGKQGFLPPLSRWVQESAGARWAGSAEGILPELLDPSLLRSFRGERGDAAPRDPRAVLQLVLLGHWLNHWKPTA